jgi:hypothetical protein
VDGPIDPERKSCLVELHRAALDRGIAAGADLGCVYVDEASLSDQAAQHPMWTHGSLVHRTLSGITRAESPRVAAGWIAWRDAHKTVRAAR